jgi:Lon protease-like protein
MAHGAKYPDTGDLPGVLPIFPLPGALLLPGGQLPLNIFEPRYLHMIIDAMGEGRLIGMIQPKPQPGEDAPNDPDLRENPPVYSVGCCGRIVNFSETGDGRLLITLLGQSRFRIEDELPPRNGYRRVTADFSPFPDDPDDDTPIGLDRARLLDAAARYLDANGLKTDWEAIEEAPDSLLVTSLAMVCPFDLREKQALLESDTPATRGVLLTELLEMGARGPAASPGGASH